MNRNHKTHCPQWRPQILEWQLTSMNALAKCSFVNGRDRMEMVTFFNPEHSGKASSAISVMESGTVIVVNCCFPLKALESMALTMCGIS